MTFVTITFTFPSPDVVFLPAQLWWHSLGSCQHPLVPSPRAGAPAAGKVPHTIPIPHSSIPASAPGESTTPCCIACLRSSSFPAPGSFIYLLLSAVFVQASRGLDKPAVQTRCSAVAVRGENCKEAPGQTSALSFLPPLLSCTTLAPLSIRLARKTRHVGAALQGLP